MPEYSCKKREFFIDSVMLFVRGVLQVLEIALSSGMNAAISGISGISGIGHMLLGISLVLLLMQIKRSILEIEN